MKTIRTLLWGLVLVALVGAAALLLMHRNAPGAGQSAESGQGPVKTTTQVTFGGPFTLVGADGKPFSSAQLAGKPYAIFFGFTNCADVCPTTLARMVRLRRQIGSGDEPFNIVFVSVDPARDTPKQVGRYAALFGDPVIGLTGSPAQIEQVKKTLGIYSAKAPDGQGGYSVNHTATVLLFGKDGKFVSTISPEEQDGAALAKLKRITA